MAYARFGPHNDGNSSLALRLERCSERFVCQTTAPRDSLQREKLALKFFGCSIIAFLQLNFSFHLPLGALRWNFYIENNVWCGLRCRFSGNPCSYILLDCCMFSLLIWNSLTANAFGIFSQFYTMLIS